MSCKNISAAHRGLHQQTHLTVSSHDLSHVTQVSVGPLSYIFVRGKYV